MFKILTLGLLLPKTKASCQAVIVPVSALVWQSVYSMYNSGVSKLQLSNACGVPTVAAVACSGLNDTWVYNAECVKLIKLTD